MTRIALLTDLHFGRASPDLVQPLLDTIDAEAPDLVALAGDFVQRARTDQFEMAEAFVARIKQPWIAVPGNHDIPLFNLPERLIAPRRAYHRHIARETEPQAELADALVIGVDTTHRFSHQRGLIRPRQIERVARAIRETRDRTVIVMAHHPFHQKPEVEKKVMKHAARALETWADCGPHVILSGHLHTWTVEPFLAEKNRSMTLQVHCGTGLSTRLRGTPNEFAMLDVEGPSFTARRFTADPETKRFTCHSASHFRRGGSGWAATDD